MLDGRQLALKTGVVELDVLPVVFASPSPPFFFVEFALGKCSLNSGIRASFGGMFEDVGNLGTASGPRFVGGRGWQPHGSMLLATSRHGSVVSSSKVHLSSSAPPILEPILAGIGGIGMFSGGTIWILTHGHVPGQSPVGFQDLGQLGLRLHRRAGPVLLFPASWHVGGITPFHSGKQIRRSRAL